MRRMKSEKRNLENLFSSALTEAKTSTLFSSRRIFVFFILLKNNQNFYNHSQKLDFVSHSLSIYRDRAKIIPRSFFIEEKLTQGVVLSCFNNINKDEYFDQFFWCHQAIKTSGRKWWMAPVSGGEKDRVGRKIPAKGKENELYSDKNKMLTQKRYFAIRRKRFIKIG